MSVQFGSASHERGHTNMFARVEEMASPLSPTAAARPQHSTSPKTSTGIGLLYHAAPPVRLKKGVDALTQTGQLPGEIYLDQQAPAAPVAPPAPAAAPAAALPTELIQILTGWTGGAAEYGFQLRFRCRSTSGRVADLQARAPLLMWRERVTYSRNDFAHRIAPPNPTILPAGGGISFAAADTRIVGTNLLEFNRARDTHHMPTNRVVAADFTPAAGRTLPAEMHSQQIYQYSVDGGGSWRYFAGAFNIRRRLYRNAAGALRFETRKSGIHSIDEPIKP